MLFADDPVPRGADLDGVGLIAVALAERMPHILRR